MVCFCLIFSALPVVPVHAADDDDDGGVSASVDVEVDVPSELAISVSDSALHFAMASNSPVSQSLTLFVETTSVNGYNVSLNTSYSYNDLKQSDTSISEVIPSITSDTALSNFSGAAWGYSLTESTDGIFHEVPVEMSQIIVGYEAGFKNYDFSVGVKTDSGTPSGTYANTLVFTALANLEPAVKTLNNITYMQDMTAEICSNTEVGASKQLIDSRDGKKYWATKLADNNCWMTQNLAYNLSTSVTLTPDDSDVLGNWTPNNNTDSWSWNPGVANSVSSGNTYVQDGNSSTTISTSNLAADSVEWHWDRGFFYNYYAVTAGYSANTATGSEVAGSICPKGWKIPSDMTGLTSLYGVSRMFQLNVSPVYLVADGINNGAAPTPGGDSGYWYSIAGGTNTGYFVQFAASYENSSNSTNPNMAIPVRCIAR